MSVRTKVRLANIAFTRHNSILIYNFILRLLYLLTG